MRAEKLKLFFLILCIIQLFYIFQFRSDFKLEVFKNSFKENYGKIYALSPAVIESNYILNNFELVDFNLSQKLQSDTYFYQRVIEFNYPIKFNKNSNQIFHLLEEEVSNSCKITKSGKYLKLIKC